MIYKQEIGRANRFKVGQRVEITRKDIFELKHRMKKGKVYGRIVSIDGEYHYVIPMWCTWKIELYRCEIKKVRTK